MVKIKISRKKILLEVFQEMISGGVSAMAAVGIVVVAVLALIGAGVGMGLKFFLEKILWWL